MTFLYPLGLLGLIGVPIVIIIYIIRSKYTEQTVPSTYIWTLSEKFLKRRNPLSGLTGIISLILQILAVIAISLTIAHPIITIEDSASEYCFVLDASGSMNMEDEEGSRFEKGKERVLEMIEESKRGSVYTLIYVSKEATVVYEKEADKDTAIQQTEALSQGFCEGNDAKAIGVAQEFFNENPSVLTYLITDKTYTEHENVNIISVKGAEQNYALKDITYNHSAGILTVSGSVISYGDLAKATVELVSGEEVVATKELDLVSGEETAFLISSEGFERFSSATVRLKNSDSLKSDDEFVIHNLKNEQSYNTLVISENPFFIQAIIDALVDVTIDVCDPDEYEGESNYGLYIFDSYTPSELPKSGAVWLINTGKSVEGSGFSVRGETEYDSAQKLEKSTSSATQTRSLLSGVSGDNTYVARHMEYSIYRTFTTLFSYESKPMIFAGTTSYGNREVVFAFDLHNSNLTLQADYVALMRNLLSYSFPDVVEKTDYACGEELNVNIVANCDSLKVITPSGETKYLETSEEVSALTLEEVGTYTILMNVAGNEKSYNIFSASPLKESNPEIEGAMFSIAGEPSNEKLDGEYDTLLTIFICLAVIFCADWMVYMYEKYQLR